MRPSQSVSARLLPFLRWGKPAFHGAIMLDDL
jgi:hypothetical protein